MDVQVEVAIADVVVYPDRARIASQGACALTAGVHRLFIEGLPLSLETDSVRVTGRGETAVRLLGVDVGQQFYEQTPAEHVRELELAIEAVQDEQRVLSDSQTIWLAQAAHLDGLRQQTAEFARGLARGRTTVTDQTSLLDFVQRQDELVRGRLRDLEIQQRTLKRRLQKLQQELNALRSAQPRQRYRVVVEVEAAGDGQFGLTLAYVVHGAGWQPLYDLRLMDGANGRWLELSAIAEITQQTGQDWRGVGLVVSTARPALNQRLPELKPWYIDVYRQPPPVPAPLPRSRAQPMVAAETAELHQMSAGMSMAKMQEADVAVAEVVAGETAVSFRVKGSIDIPSDGSPHKTVVNQFRLEPKLDYFTAPRHTAAVYRRAKMVNSGPGPLLAGPASLFVNDEFIGRTHLAYTPSQGEIELLLGSEDRLLVTRELTKRDVDKRLLRDNRQLRYGYKIEVKSGLTTAVDLVIQDQIPVSRHEEIRVKLEQTNPAAPERSELNLLEWQIRLGANETRTITYDYSVEHPRALTVVGLRDE